MSQENFRFFSHKKCEYYPCHAGAVPEQFNCLFCYCPLYALGPDCGGHFSYTEKGIKNCTRCLLPHTPGGYDYVIQRFSEIVARMKEFDAGRPDST